MSLLINPFMSFPPSGSTLAFYVPPTYKGETDLYYNPYDGSASVNPGYVSVKVTGGTAPYTYKLYAGATLISTGTAWGNIYYTPGPTVQGALTVAVTDANNNTITSGTLATVTTTYVTFQVLASPDTVYDNTTISTIFAGVSENGPSDLATSATYTWYYQGPNDPSFAQFASGINMQSVNTGTFGVAGTWYFNVEITYNGFTWRNGCNVTASY